MNNCPDPSRDRPPAPAGEGSVLDWARREGEAEWLIENLDRFLLRRRQRRRHAALAAVAVVVLLVAGLTWRPWSPRANTFPAASAGEVVVSRPVVRTLPDGSVLELNVGAEIDVDFAGPLRRVVLRRGEGHFQVAKDARRPFVVAAGEIEVRAVGTAFSVDRAVQSVAVLVTEGRVAVEQPSPVTPIAVMAAVSAPLGTLDAGRRMVVTLPTESPVAAVATEVTTVSAQEMRQHLAWRVPRLEFAATPLARVVVLFNEQAAVSGRERLVVSDASLERIQLSGVLRADDIESLLRLLEGQFQIRAERQGNEIVLRRN